MSRDNLGIQDEVHRLLDSLRVGVPEGVWDEIDAFKPEGWTSSVSDGVYVVEGPKGPEWHEGMWKLIQVLKYPKGSLVRRISKDRWELYTWRNDNGDGFKVVFAAQSQA